jgi:23S rRNA (uracil1939-C5)-methyltransferase
MTVHASAGTCVDLPVDSIAAGGDGVGRAEGLVVFVPRTAPGDVARVRIEAAKRFARGHLEEVLVPSPLRIEPSCAHYTDDRCGGCQLQHIAYDAQLEAKRRIVADSLQRIAKRPSAPPEIRRSAREWRYRTKLTLTMRRDDDNWTMGLRPYDDPAGLFQLRDCPITDERVVTTWREIMTAAALLPAADELRGVVRLTGEDRVVIIRGGREWPRANEFFEAVSTAAGLWWAPEGANVRLLYERRHAPAAASFGQVNAAVAKELLAHVVGLVAAHAPATVVDAYSGTGETAVALARSGARVTAIELDRDAADWCARQLPAGSRSIAGRVEDLLMRALPADAVILNPPRSGLHERVAAALGRSTPKPGLIIYVSCDPATLARDLARMPGYAVMSLVAFDMFPQTAHVETVCELVPAAA